MSVTKDITDYVRSQIASIEEELFELQHSIWENPELAYKVSNTFLTLEHKKKLVTNSHNA